MLQVNPGQAGARVSEAMALQALGRHEEAAPALEMIVANVDQYPFMRPSVLPLLIADRMSKPADQRDWTDVEKIADAIMQDPKRTEVDNAVMKAELLMMQDKLDEEGPRGPGERSQDIRVWTSMVVAAADNRTAHRHCWRRRRKSATCRNCVRFVFGTRPRGAAPAAPPRSSKAWRSGGGAYHSDVATGRAYLQVRFDAAKRCWRYVIAHDPHAPSVRSCSVMSDTKDDAGMQEVIKRFRAHGWGRKRSLQVLRRRIAGASIMTRIQGRKSRSPTRSRPPWRARKLVDEAIAVRGEWGPLWRVRAEPINWKEDR
jgi:hypothetical protein